ncbi:MAG TPA: hypothetical protein VHK69_03735 [Chitinophagaceae bacterium]|jgi:heme/copper-type cytochrome/quinol oxidase subunit 1|nr:hypothetical protein [Chitinophagaceae bacterium]
MSRPLHPFLRELLWLTAAAVVTLILCGPLLSWNFRVHTVDLHVYDTYFVLAPVHFLIPVFLFLTFFLYLVRVVRQGFRRSLPNRLFLLSGLLFLLLLLLAQKEFLLLMWGTGGTVYPPLSGLGGTAPEPPEADPSIPAISNGLIVAQLLVAGVLWYAAYRWGRNARGPVR